mmetsp:Transcript_4845/g.6099  ORF Transcript_4845/g.6099 Transcript_4845/m.6099 type:complete len:124 (+) Transcript_4845:654-1025(+)
MGKELRAHKSLHLAKNHEIFYEERMVDEFVTVGRGTKPQTKKGIRAHQETLKDHGARQQGEGGGRPKHNQKSPLVLFEVRFKYMISPVGNISIIQNHPAYKGTLTNATNQQQHLQQVLNHRHP